ncbi:MAG: head-tail connector protein, partial [Hyphomicrobiales bacterium]|nr:head-tail connector protein [Hyphomicrobiales bacterium]
MTPILQSAPAVEPVSLAEAKNWLRISHDSDDLLIEALITSARLVVEAHAQLVLIAQSWRIVADAW